MEKEQKPNIEELFTAFRKFATACANFGVRNNYGLWKAEREKFHTELDKLGVGQLFDWTEVE